MIACKRFYGICMRHRRFPGPKIDSALDLWFGSYVHRFLSLPAGHQRGRTLSRSMATNSQSTLDEVGTQVS